MSLAKDAALKIPPLRRLVDQRNALQRENVALRRQVEMLGIDTDLQYLFVVTYGRSGSTLLQGILNSIPGYLIRGENQGTPQALAAKFAELNDRSKEFRRKAGTPTNPWYGMDGYSRESAAALLRQFLVAGLFRPESDTRVTGCKEIRWWGRDLTQTLMTVREILPGARFIFNTRNVEDVLKSKWWVERDPEVGRAQVLDWESRMDAAAAALGDGVTYRVQYDDYLADHGVLEGLFDWLGEPFDRQRIDEVIATPHSF